MLPNFQVQVDSLRLHEIELRSQNVTRPQSLFSNFLLSFTFHNNTYLSLKLFYVFILIYCVIPPQMQDS